MKAIRRPSRARTVEGGTLSGLSLGEARLGRALDRDDEVLAVLDIVGGMGMDGVGDLHIHSGIFELLTRAAATTEKAPKR
jgi:hypothetical protein